MIATENEKHAQNVDRVNQMLRDAAAAIEIAQTNLLAAAVVAEVALGNTAAGKAAIEAGKQFGEIKAVINAIGNN